MSGLGMAIGGCRTPVPRFGVSAASNVAVLARPRDGP
jgi:hypothetical protein